MNNTSTAILAEDSAIEKATSQSFFKFSPAMAKKLRQASLTASEWKLWSYLITLDPFGDRYMEMPDVLTIMSECGMSKASVYRAMSKFQHLELFDFHTTTKFRNLNSEKSVSNLRKNSQSCETKLKTEKPVSVVRESTPETQLQQEVEIPQTIQTSSDASESEEEVPPPAAAPLGGASPASHLDEQEKELTTKETFDWLDRADTGECPPLWAIQQLLDGKYCVNIRGALTKFEEQWGLTVVNYQVIRK